MSQCAADTGAAYSVMCKICKKAFNDKTGTLLHYKSIGMGKWMLSVRMYLCGPLSRTSVNRISE